MNMVFLLRTRMVSVIPSRTVVSLRFVKYPIAFNPNQNLKEQAEKEHWRIVIEKKDVVYEITPGHDFISLK
jgi:hypothetical protein